MFPLLLLIPGALLVWSLAKKHAERQQEEHFAAAGEFERAVERALARRFAMGAPPPPPHHRHHMARGPAMPAALPPAPMPMPPPSAPPPMSPSTAAYVQHLAEASAAASALNMIRPAAIEADMGALMHAPPEAVHALMVLAQPIDMLTVQRDLNLLGASPPLPETGVMDARTDEAVRAFQERFKQHPTGTVDEGTAIALRYSVGVVHFQNQLQAAA